MCSDSWDGRLRYLIGAPYVLGHGRGPGEWSFQAHLPLRIGRPAPAFLFHPLWFTGGGASGIQKAQITDRGGDQHGDCRARGPVRSQSPDQHRLQSMGIQAGDWHLTHAAFLDAGAGPGKLVLSCRTPTSFKARCASRRRSAPRKCTASYTFRPGFWVALDGTYYTGGRTHVNGVRSDDLQQNSRLGTTMALPLTRSQSLKLALQQRSFGKEGRQFHNLRHYLSAPLVYAGARSVALKSQPQPLGRVAKDNP